MSIEELPSYNQIFEKLVLSQPENSQERLIGMLAYAEYKLDKHEWMCENSTASREQVSTAFLSHYNDRRLRRYRTDAENVLLSYAGEYAAGILKDQLERSKNEGISRDLRDLETHLTTEIKATKVSYMKPVWQSVVASAIFSVMLFVLALIIRFAAPNSSAGQLLQYLMAPENYELRVIEKGKNPP